MNRSGSRQVGAVQRTLFGEFMVLITLIMVPTVLVIGWYVLRHVDDLTREQKLVALATLAEEKAGTINRYIDAHLGRVETLGTMPMVVDALPPLKRAFDRAGPDSDAYRAVARRYGGHLADYLWRWGYYDLFLIDAEGDIVFTIKHEKDFGTNLRHGPYRESGLGRVFRSAIGRMQVGNSSFDFYPPSGEAAAFVAAPVLADGRVIGVVALQFDTEALYRVVNDLTGLGESGEVVVGRQQGDGILITAPLRHDLQAAFRRRVALSSEIALPIRDGSRGGSGSGELIDWRGERVLAVWQYLPALRWGMVVKIDAAEVFGHWHAVQRQLLGVFGIALLVGYLMIYLVARRRTEPLKRLTEFSANYTVGGGGTELRALASSSNEVGVLARTLHDMVREIDRGQAEQERLIAELAESNRQLDARVAERTEHLRAVLDHAADGIVVIDGEGVIRQANPALARIFGYTDAASMEGMEIALLMPEQYRKRHRARLAALAGQDGVDINLAVELEGLRRSGEVFPVDIRVTDMEVAGRRLFLGIMRDITVRRRLEEEQRKLAVAVEHAEDAIFITDVEGRINYVNPAYERLSGFGADELLGNRPSLMKSGRMSDAFYRDMWQTILSGRLWRSEFTNRRKNGEIYEVDQSISPILGTDGSVVGFVSVQRDITAEKQERAQLEHTQRLESLGVLAGGIAHDFNNLLTAIMGNAALARMRIDPDCSAVPMLENVERASERAAALCKQMLAYSGKGKFVVEPINLTELIEEMTSLLEVSISKNVVMRLDLSKQLPPIEADAAQMQQVVMNLVINASEAIGDRSGIVTISTGATEVNAEYIETTYLKDHIQPGRYVTIEVSDTGCGMDEETKKKIFDPFFTTKFTGRGLGMSAILGIVRGHHGAIKVYSEPGKGTTFKLLFPCAELQGSIAHGRKRHADVRDGEVRGRGTVLVVDDEETIRVTAAAMLEDVGFTVLMAEDGVQAVEIFRERHEEIRGVLLDMTMPRMGGEETFREMRTIDPKVRVVLSSGYNEQDATSHFAGKGLAGFIQKPYSPRALQEKMVAILVGDDDGA